LSDLPPEKFLAVVRIHQNNEGVNICAPSARRLLTKQRKRENIIKRFQLLRFEEVRKNGRTPKQTIQGARSPAQGGGQSVFAKPY
jgi:hypothetical protein